MARSSIVSDERHRPPPSGAPPFGSRLFPPNRRPPPPFYPHQHYRLRTPPPAAPVDRPPRPCFIVELHLRHHLRRGWSAGPGLNALVASCRPQPANSTFYAANEAALYFERWEDARDAALHLWESRLSGAHPFSPELASSITLPDAKQELEESLKALFLDKIGALMDGEVVRKWEVKLGEVNVEIDKVKASMRRWMGIKNFGELGEKQKGLSSERQLIEKRIMEFKSAMMCIRDHIEGNAVEETLQVFKFENGYVDWSRIHQLILRECKRLDDGLPIYACRQGILQEVYNQQVMVLIGETGSGKSTQLIQFLADSGVGAYGSIVCTQPRKIAASSLAERVRDESVGCYAGNSVVCDLTFSSSQFLKSKVVYMTDHRLLQHYMCDENLSGISCIIIDEAHERSLSTDLLLAVIKELLCRRPKLRLIIMSATADADQLSEYFYGCAIFRVVGRNFPVDIRYVPPSPVGASSTGVIASYVADVLRMASDINRREREGTILAFLTSQMEVEWACENFEAPSAVALPLHGKLAYEEQLRVFQEYPGKRKVIFSTNLAETSLTIPGVKYVIDSGWVKESKFEPGTGMNVLRVCRISQSSANQRAGRAGRTEPGRCYRLYAESDFVSMPLSQEPEILRVHLGIAVLRILALGIDDLRNFDFVDAPSDKAIDMAIRNLFQLGAITVIDGTYQLTDVGGYLVKVGAEPRLGKLIYSCFRHDLGREGVVLAAVMANASSIFCRVGSDTDKLKSDCLKLQFCHHDGDLFTLLSVYKEWESVPQEKRNLWCWENSINAKSMRRCQETVKEFEDCLRRELSITVPSLWHWDPYKPNKLDDLLKRVILSCLAENVAMYSGCDKLGYEVALTGQHIQLHPSCSLLSFGQKPRWVVFGEIIASSTPYLVCVTAFDFDFLSTLCPPPLFDFDKIESRKLQSRVMTGYGSTLLKRFCGRFNCSLQFLISHIREECMDERVTVQVNVDQNEVSVFASSLDMKKVFTLVSDSLECEKKWLLNECIEKCLYHCPGVSAPVALFGAGAEIRHLELEKNFLTIDVCHPDVNSVDDKELLGFLEKHAQGSICAVHKFTGNSPDGDDKDRWGRITFATPEAAKRAAEMKEVEFGDAMLKLHPSRSFLGSDNKFYSFPAVKAKVYWPRRESKGYGIVKCDVRDVPILVFQFSNLVIGGHYIRCDAGKNCKGSVVIKGLGKELSEAEILDELRRATNRRILDFFLVRGNFVENPPINTCEEALLREITPFMPKNNPRASHFSVQVFPPEPKDTNMKALITFDGRLHLEAAKALEQIDGKVLPGFLPWQKITCQQLFHTSLSCPAPVYYVIKEQLDDLLASFKEIEGAECHLDRTSNRCFRVRISANATRTVAEMRRPVEELMRGKTVDHPNLTPAVVQILFSRDGTILLKSIERETGTWILFDRHTLKLKVFGSSEKIAVAEEKLITALLNLNKSKQLEIRLRGRDLPPDMMKEVVKKFGPNLDGLKEKVPDAEICLNARRHIISMKGNKDMKEKVEEIIYDLAKAIGTSSETSDEVVGAAEDSCPICFCEVEDGYQLEGCSHRFCRACLVEQCESAIRNLDSFPICCAREVCGAPLLVTDLRLLLSAEKLDELFRASLGAFVASSGGLYRFCPSPDCPSVYRVTGPGILPEPFLCGACYAETCTRCHLEYHPYVSCERYREYKEDPDLSLKQWCVGRDDVKECPQCGYTIEKVDGCNHIECRCGRHLCWKCLKIFRNSEDCYDHLRSVHLAIT
ncbi:hypothetical protein BT93_H3391 [Corymbia citriodora subsp. variegata]|nr:hypothetical protein BT93_H3391 [Corymbia citriodora subsp. variegata]